MDFPRYSYAVSINELSPPQQDLPKISTSISASCRRLQPNRSRIEWLSAHTFEKSFSTGSSVYGTKSRPFWYTYRNHCQRGPYNPDAWPNNALTMATLLSLRRSPIIQTYNPFLILDCFLVSADVLCSVWGKGFTQNCLAGYVIKLTQGVESTDGINEEILARRSTPKQASYMRT